MNSATSANDGEWFFGFINPRNTLVLWGVERASERLHMRTRVCKMEIKATSKIYVTKTIYVFYREEEKSAYASHVILTPTSFKSIKAGFAAETGNWEEVAWAHLPKIGVTAL